MLGKADIVDIIADRLSSAAPGARASVKRVFLSDWELRRMRAPGAKSITVPAGAIISPLSRDWLDYEGIEIAFR